MNRRSEPAAAPRAAGVPALVAPGPDLTAAEKRRYARQLTLPAIGLDGQRRLKNARVLCVGAGGLGAPALLYLAAAGVGTLGVIDDDRVDESNLQRQIIHDTQTVGELKTASAAQRLATLNPGVTVVEHPVRLSPHNALDILGEYDLILDGTDNFSTRYLVADASEILRQPVVWGALLREHGHVSVFWPGHGPTYRDLYPTMPNPDDVPTCAAAGVLGATCAIIGATMASEAIKLITGSGTPLIGRLQMYDALTARWRELTLTPDDARTPVTQLQETYEWGCGGAESSAEAQIPTLQPDELRDALRERASGKRSFVLLDVRTPSERETDAVADSQHIPLDELLQNVEVLPRQQRYVVYCASGMRSARAAQAMQEAGFTVAHLDGGLTAYRALTANEPADG